MTDEQHVNYMKLVLGGIVLMIIGGSIFLHSLGSGGGKGATLTFIAGAVVFMIGCVKYFLKKPHNTRPKSGVARRSQVGRYVGLLGVRHRKRPNPLSSA